MASRRLQLLELAMGYETRTGGFTICGWRDDDGVLWQTWQEGPEFLVHDPFDPIVPETGWYMEERTHTDFGEVKAFDDTCAVSSITYVPCDETDEPAPSGDSLDLGEQYALIAEQDLSGEEWTEWNFDDFAPHMEEVRGLGAPGIEEFNWDAWRTPVWEGFYNYAARVSLSDPLSTTFVKVDGRFKLRKSPYRVPVKFFWEEALYDIDTGAELDRQPKSWLLASLDSGDIASDTHTTPILITMPAAGTPTNYQGLRVKVENLKVIAPWVEP